MNENEKFIDRTERQSINLTRSVPRVSVIVPTFNRKHLLSDAIGSCLTQAFTDLEVIVVDDGSTDGTGRLVADLVASRPSKGIIRYVRQDNQGASAARNHGLELARGDYVQFLDSDDLLLPSKLASQVGVLDEEQNSDAACCSCYGAIGALRADSTRATSTRIGIRANSPVDLVRALCSRVVHGMQTSAPLWRRTHLMTHAGWREDISLGDDLEYHVRLLADAKKICFIEEALFFVREHPGSRLSADQISASSLGSLIKTRQAIFETLQQSRVWDAQSQRAFLSAMRTIYANALQLGNDVTIRDLENWLWILADAPARHRQFHAMIALRRVLGRHALLGAHELIRKIRPT